MSGSVEFAMRCRAVTTEGIIAWNATGGKDHWSVTSRNRETNEDPTVSDAIERAVAENVVLVPVREVAGLVEVAGREGICKRRVVDRLHVHVVEDLHARTC